MSGNVCRSSQQHCIDIDIVYKYGNYTVQKWSSSRMAKVALCVGARTCFRSIVPVLIH